MDGWNTQYTIHTIWWVHIDAYMLDHNESISAENNDCYLRYIVHQHIFNARFQCNRWARAATTCSLHF